MYFTSTSFQSPKYVIIIIQYSTLMWIIMWSLPLVTTHCVINHWQFHCFFNSLLKVASKKQHSSILLTICEGNLLVTAGFPPQRARWPVIWKVLLCQNVFLQTRPMGPGVHNCDIQKLFCYLVPAMYSIFYQIRMPFVVFLFCCHYVNYVVSSRWIMSSIHSYWHLGLECLTHWPLGDLNLGW